MSQNTTVGAFNIGIKYDTDTLNQLEAQLKHIAEQVDRINGRRYDAGMTLSADTREAKSAADILDEVGKAFERTKKAYLMSAGISYANKDNDNHLRQIVREEIRQFVTRESGRGGLFSKW
ncbi:hypothetical protein KKI90_16345 [Xenorhabdus bovienii]|uniref:hypothetical protein n=1 Tax=Xenorhabdus bovienii TaxID=40576 RepID=UPI00237CC301|nr:hypothetical protein [Xenorhabdus bovienii]MDE1487884.1 hypothetical protein [Xenorhabdus bovienii]MDE9478786.1 hypothetical protein [Xenorhabdus bovienii]MDE9531582.1 hypothetical protein [Xenorhabdus bovienii]